MATPSLCAGWDVATVREIVADTIYVIGANQYGEQPCDTKGVGCGNGRSNGREVLYSTTAGDPDGAAAGTANLRTFTDGAWVLRTLVVERATPEARAGIDVWGHAGQGIGLMRGIKAAFDPAGLFAPDAHRETPAGPLEGTARANLRSIEADAVAVTESLRRIGGREDGAQR